ncbi:hypothetical protein J2045_003331 [Peteryoungia aggregata LMG 23059]|uniref:Uncharacterized protein n=1 Tax=Peteryoungia aggregata LMG 23059 TaxID=1368425 RepID=A0ABU0GAA5_9HYPH|nr:hypothetical protein [Peteryoungia aggregata]MDQ0422283.1 hypothetical protein [Peteryoungia aggregata LMG 23059]
MGIPRQAARLASLYNSGGLLDGLRNKLLNGACSLIQRGSRTIAAGASGYVLDRFLVTNDTNQPVTVSQHNLGLASGFAPGGRHAMRLAFATAPTTGTLRIEQRIEGVDTIRPDLWTFIAWMTGPADLETVAAEFVQNFGTGGSPSAAVTTAMTAAGDSPTTIKSATTNRRSWLVQVPALTAKLLGTGNNDYAAPAIVMAPRSVGNYDVTWMSFVEGDATGEFDPFNPRHQAQELWLCQRYFETCGQIRGSQAASGANGFVNWLFKAQKRATPIFVAGGGSSFTASFARADGVELQHTGGAVPSFAGTSTADAELT